MQISPQHLSSEQKGLRAQRAFHMLEAVKGHPYFQTVSQALQRLILLGILVYLIYRLTDLQWPSIFQALPSNPLFYTLSIAIFAAVPVFEILSYQIITNQKIKDGFRLFSRKRVFNEALLSYSGEAYLCEKIAQNNAMSLQRAMSAVKDNNLISALISNSWTVILIVLVVLFGRSDVLQSLWNVSPVLIGSFGVICLTLYILMFSFLRKLTSLALMKILKLAGLHSGKVLCVAALQMAQWASAIPAESLKTWALFLTVQLLIKRIPGLPNADLIFLGVGLSLVGFAETSSTEITAMLLAAAAMMQCVYLMAFILTSGKRGA